MSSAMPLIRAIEYCIREASEQYNLNATDIIVNDRRVQWRSRCGGPIGEMIFRVPIQRFEHSIEVGVADVSTLISFASLTLREENREFAENIRIAVDCYEAPCYFRVNDTMNGVLVHITSPLRETYTSLNIEYVNDGDTGEYVWHIPTSVSSQTPPRHVPMVDDTTDPPVVHVTNDSIGLRATQSQGMYVRGVSDSIREYTEYPDSMISPTELSDDDDEISIGTVETEPISSDPL